MHITARDRASVEAASAAAVKGAMAGDLEQHKVELRNLESLARSSFISANGCALLHLPNPTAPPAIQVSVVPDDQLSEPGPSGGANRFRRLGESPTAAEEMRDSLLFPPLIVEQVEA